MQFKWTRAAVGALHITTLPPSFDDAGAIQLVYALMSFLADVWSLEESALPSIIYSWISLWFIFPSFAFSTSSRFATLPHRLPTLCTDFAFSGHSFAVTDCPRLSNSSAVSESETIFFALFAFLRLFFIYLTFFMATRLSGRRTLI